MKIFKKPFQILSNKNVFFEEIKKNKEIYEKIFKQFFLMILFFFIYGFIIGLSNNLFQSISSSIKLPLLFIITLLICFPTLYIFNLLFGSKLTISQHLALFLSMQFVTSIFLIAFSPITIFFLITGKNYQFFKLLNVFIFAISGIIGIFTLYKGILITNNEIKIANSNNPPKISANGFIILWIILYSFVGCQLAWALRPFFGDPRLPFQLLRDLSGNFYFDIIQAIREILGFK